MEQSQNAIRLPFTAGYIVYFKTLNPSLDNAEGWWLEFPPEAALGTIVNLAVSYAVSRFTPEPPVEVQEIVQNIRLPKGFNKNNDGLNLTIKS